MLPGSVGGSSPHLPLGRTDGHAPIAKCCGESMESIDADTARDFATPSGIHFGFQPPSFRLGCSSLLSRFTLNGLCFFSERDSIRLVMFPSTFIRIPWKEHMAEKIGISGSFHLLSFRDSHFHLHAELVVLFF